ncbi:MAG: hypothetical protein ICV79_27720, partial [Flavisolibacter sp.]|nr:hypothetical protein [Flavisolibacter sp.]
MPLLQSKKFLLFSLLVVAVAASAFLIGGSSQTVDFNTEVKPIFNKKCITCHGGVRRKADFSLLFRSEALANTESGKPAIIPGHPEKSELMRRVKSNDPEER